MGKRIPGKKHRGIKDPLVQKAVRDEALKNLINAPPKVEDWQEMPKSVETIMKLKQMTKEGKFDKRKKKKKTKNKLMDTARLTTKEKVLPGMTKPDRNLPVLVQNPGESSNAFLSRFDRATNEFIKQVNFEVDNHMKMRKDEKTGEMKFDKIEMDPIDKLFQDRVEAINQKHICKKKAVEGVLSKTAKRRMRLQAKKERQNELEGEAKGGDEFEKFQDKVEFNEIVHRPPTLTALPRKAEVSEAARRPASKPGLLLAQMLMSGEGQRRDLTGRRKDLSYSDRRRLDSAQVAAIDAYRQIKAARSKSMAVT